MTTRLSRSSASTRAASRSIVVLPMPGRPMIRIDWPDLDEVVDDLDGAEDGPPDAAGEAHDLAAAVADGADAVERALDAGAVVVTERADVVDHVLDVLRLDLAVEQDLLAATAEAGLRPAAEVHDDLDDAAYALEGAHALADLGRQRLEERLEVVGHGLRT